MTRWKLAAYSLVAVVALSACSTSPRTVSEPVAVTEPIASTTTNSPQTSNPTTTLPPVVPIPTQWQVLERPLHLPTITGTDCPTSPVSEFGRHQARGDGPIRLSTAGLSFLQIFPVATQVGAFPTVKPYWLWQPGMTTDVLLRGANLRDGSPMLFEIHSYDARPTQRWTVLRHDPQAVPGAAATGGWDISADLAWVTAPGCYGLQLDSADFSIIIVTDVRPS